MSSSEYEFYLPDKEKKDGFKSISVWDSTYKDLMKLKHRLESLSEGDVSMAQVVEGLWVTLKVEVEDINIEKNKEE